MIDQEFIKRIDAAIERVINRGHDPEPMLKKKQAYLEGKGQRVSLAEYLIAGVGSQIPNVNIRCDNGQLVNHKQKRFNLQNCVETFKRECLDEHPSKVQVL